MKSAKDGVSFDASDSLNLASDRRILVQGSMRSVAIVIVGVGFQNSAQMRLAQDNDVVHTLTPDRSDQPLGKAILPRRGRCGRLVPDAHGAQSARDDAAIDPVAIADEVVRSLIPRKYLRYLTCNPFCRRICCDVDPDEVSAVEPDDDEGIDQVETDSWNNEQVHGGNVRRVVAQEGSPSLAGWPPSFDQGGKCSNDDTLGRGLYLGGWSPGEYSASNEFKSADFGVGSSCRKQEGCMSKFAIRLLTLAMFSMALVAAPLVTKVHANPDSDAPPPSSSKSKAKKKSSEVSPSIEDAAFAKGYHAAYVTIYDRNDYAAAIDQLKALGHNDSAAVANLIGYSYRKLGDYKVSQIWYERALKADPNHVKTWQY